MSYTEKSFWDQYKDYVEESLPRHQRVIEMFLGFERPLSQLDLGCGGCKEAKQLLSPNLYFGVDAAVDPAGDGVLEDYRKHLWRVADSLYFPPECFTSLFSSEVTGSFISNSVLYDRLFRMFPSIRYGIVSGFYYGNRRDQEKVTENGGLESYQSIQDIHETMSPYYKETRILLPAPSTMFGRDVIEVWKFLERK